MKTIDKIIKNNSIKLFGFCDFSKLDLLDCRAKSRIPENAKTVIMLAFPYKLPDEYYKNLNISKYAVVKDYHLVLGDYLTKITGELRAAFPSEKFEWFSDNSPIPEVDAAVKSGIGVKGDNGLLITKDYGSWVFLGEIVTTLKTDATDYNGECLHCGMCKQNCDVVCGDKKKNCLSSLTQAKGELTPDTVKIMKQRKTLWGCDLCQDICPMNVNIKTEPIKEFLDDVISEVRSDVEIENRAFGWRGKKVIERNIRLFYK